MKKLRLPKCHYLGPRSDEDETDRVALPPDAASDPFAYLPDSIQLSAEELELANRYENGDFSGGYLRSQIAYFRRRKPKKRHEERRERLRRLQSLVANAGLKLPDSFVKLVETDDYVDRIRHNTIWLYVPEEIVPFPKYPTSRLACVFHEGCGGGFWHLLLSPDESHLVAYSYEAIGPPDVWPGDFKPDLTTYEFYQCASSFDEWLAYYFLDCIECDKRYAETLEKYPGM